MSPGLGCKPKDFFNKYVHEKLISIVLDAIVAKRNDERRHTPDTTGGVERFGNL